MSKIPTARIDKLLSSLGYGSRSDVPLMAKMGRIFLDGKPVRDVSQRLQLTDDLSSRLSIDRQPLDPLMGVVILMHKPVGVTCSHKESGALVYDLLPDRWGQRTPALSSVGRLDKDTSGLLLITDDGPLLHRIISPKRHIKKTYLATLDRPLNGTEIDIFASGTMMLNGETKPLAPAELKIVSSHQALLTITEGRYHQVRRMFAATGNHVTQLHRTTLGGLALPDTLAPGEWTVLSPGDINLIFA